jgi:hypothetical protein
MTDDWTEGDLQDWMNELRTASRTKAADPACTHTDPRTETRQGTFDTMWQVCPGCGAERSWLEYEGCRDDQWGDWLLLDGS